MDWEKARIMTAFGILGTVRFFFLFFFSLRVPALNTSQGACSEYTRFLCVTSCCTINQSSSAPHFPPFTSPIHLLRYALLVVDCDTRTASSQTWCLCSEVRHIQTL